MHTHTNAYTTLVLLCKQRSTTFERQIVFRGARVCACASANLARINSLDGEQISCPCQTEQTHNPFDVSSLSALGRIVANKQVSIALISCRR